MIDQACISLLALTAANCFLFKIVFCCGLKIYAKLNLLGEGFLHFSVCHRGGWMFFYLSIVIVNFFLLIVFYCTFSISCEVLSYFVYNYCILLR